MIDLVRISNTYTTGIAGLGGVDEVTNLLTLVFLTACVALAFSRSAIVFGATMLAWAVTVRLPVFAAFLGNPDEAHMLAGARRLYYDPVFWRSVDGVTSGPLNYYALAAMRLFGLSLNFAAARAANMLCLWGAVVFLWLAAREFMPEWAARLSVLPWLAAALGFRFGEFLQYSSECVPLLLGSLALWLLVRRRWFALGIVLVYMPLSKLQELPIAAVFGVAAAYAAWRGERREVVRLAAGIAAALLSLIAFLTVFGLWFDFGQSYLWNNLSYVTNGHGALGDTEIHHDVVEWNFVTYFAFITRSEITRFLAWMALWIVPVTAWRHRVSSLGLLAGALFAASLYAIYRPGRAFPHYLLLLMFPVALGGMLALAAAIKSCARPKLVAAAFVVVTVLAPTIQGIVTSPPGALAAIATSSTDMSAPIVGRLNSWAQPGDLVAVWGWAAELNVLTATVSAARDPQSQRQIEDGPQRAYYRHRYVQDLRANPPRVFADAVGPLRLVFQNRAAQGYESVPELREFVDANYQLQDDVQGVRVFARKGACRIDQEPPASLPLSIAAGTDEDRFHYGGGRFEFREETVPAGYRSARFCRSTCEYSIPLENGHYRLRLYFIEQICAAPGLRVFNVTVNQTPVLRDFDIFKQTGTRGVPAVWEFPIDVKEGRLTIGLVPNLREAEISRIEVLK